ncbi:MAG: 4Fe-4S binding protein [Promethearchaeota archaeon]
MHPWLVRNKMRLFRSIIQLLVFLFIYGVIFDLAFAMIIVPFVQPTGAPYTTVAGAYDILLTSLAFGIFPLLALGIILLTAVFFGRTFCAWACPFGFVEDLLSYIRPKKHVKLITRHTDASLRQMRLYIIFATVLISTIVGIRRLQRSSAGIVEAFGPFANNSFAPIDPAATLFSFLPNFFANLLIFLPPSYEKLYQLGGWPVLLWVRVAFFVIIVLVSIYVPRMWCRYLCPLGGILGYCGKYGLLTIKRNPIRCPKGECDKCMKVCPMGVRLLEGEEYEKVRDDNCILCLECVNACSHDALSVSLI